MKKHLLSIALGLLVGTSAFAQVEFVDEATGEVIPNGSTVVKNIIDTPLELPIGKNQQISSGLSKRAEPVGRDRSSFWTINTLLPWCLLDKRGSLQGYLSYS